MTLFPFDLSIEKDFLKRFWPVLILALIVVVPVVILSNYSYYESRQEAETFAREAIPADAIVAEYLGSEPFRYGRHGSYRDRHRYILSFDGHKGFTYSMKKYPVGHTVKVLYVPNDTRGYHCARRNLELVEDESK